MSSIKNDAMQIVEQAIQAVLPDQAVQRALQNRDFSNTRLHLIAVGKAAWTMAKAADSILGRRIEKGIVITKYGYVQGEIADYQCFEAGHPIPDARSLAATRETLAYVKNLTSDDTVLLLLSGGGSALFEDPLIPEEELTDITQQLLACGADIVEINTIRKRLSRVKGGRFALACSPAKIFCIVLSDIIGDPLDMIASGPAYPDTSTTDDAKKIIDKYQLSLSEQAVKALEIETPKRIDNVETVVTGSVRELCRAAEKAAEHLGYETEILTDHLDCIAREAGTLLGDIALSHQDIPQSRGWILGGETVVQLTGSGKGGRNQEIALSAAEKLAACHDTAVFSVGSDGTDGPTDAAGGFADEQTKAEIEKQGRSIYQILKDNDSYNALKSCDGLIVTGPTGTNVNDFAMLLIKR